MSIKEILTNQPLLNIGTLGSVSDGKSTLIYQLTGIKTQRHSSEKEKNITIKPGYANLKLWQCEECNHLSSSASKFNELSCELCNANCKLNHYISIIDNPGHISLILTMMGSISLMSGAIVVVSASESIKKKPQLIQHLMAAKMAKLDKIIICMNKIDLVSKETILKRKEELDELLKVIGIVPLKIIPTSFTKKLGVDYLVKYLLKYFPKEDYNNTNKDILFRITRSFDINKPGTNWENVSGGVIGGSLISGELNIGDEIEIKPGILIKNKDGTYTNTIIKTKILSLETDNIKLDKATPGGLIAILTDIDPYYVKNDLLSGNVIGDLDIYNNIDLLYKKLEEFDGLWDPKEKDIVYLQLGNISCEAKLIKIHNDKMSFQLLKPSCIEKNSQILICRKDTDILKIVGRGTLV
jgi:translation initiation factor 2 subunit 3